MARARTERKKTRSTAFSDAVLGLFIPVFFAALATYQQFTKGEVDKYVIGALIVFGLGALGWRLDVFFDAWIAARSGAMNQNSEEEPTSESEQE